MRRFRYSRRALKQAFASLPRVDRKRFTFDLSHRVTTSFPIGKLVPVEISEVLPGDTWKRHVPSLTKLTSTFIRPIMDDMYLDTFAFFVPLRILYDKTEDVFGDSNPSAYSSPSLASFPVIPPTEEPDIIVSTPKSVADYLGIPTYTSLAPPEGYSVLPFRGFAFIDDEYFRNQNVDQEMVIQTGEASPLESLNDAPWSNTNYTGMLPPVTRYNDYFSTCFLAPQKGPAVKILSSDLPVIPKAKTVSSVLPQSTTFYPGGGSPSSIIASGSSPSVMRGVRDASLSTTENYQFANLWADVSGGKLNGDVDTNTINSLRTAFQIEKYLERDSIFGSRYREYLYAAYGVESDDASLQIPQFLGRSHTRLNVSSVASTSPVESTQSGQDDVYPVGQYAGNSQTFASNSLRFTNSFTEHGYIFVVGCIRYKHLYSQGINMLWKRHSRMDFFDPLFANLGQKAVFVDELVAGYADGTTDASELVFGYQEAWSEYRTALSRVSGEMRPSPGGLGQIYSVADYFENLPTLSDIVHEDSTPFDRVLSVSQSKQDPFIIDFQFNDYVSRVVPAHSIPGYVDHH